MSRFTKGFLSGVLVAVTITLIAPHLVHFGTPESLRRKAEKIRTFTEMVKMSSAVDEYLSKTGHLPSEGTNFVADLIDEGIIQDIPKDIWGNGFVLRQVDYVIVSMGKDEKFKSMDDLILPINTPNQGMDFTVAVAQQF